MDEHREDEFSGEIVSDEDAALDAIMAGLATEYGVLPEEALLQARQRREAIIPRLIDSIRAAADEVKIADCIDSNTHVCALFLLWEFRAKEALDAVVEAVSLPGDGAYALFGDIVTECLPRIFAVLAEDRLDVLDAMIRNPELDEYVRWEAANAFVYLVLDGKLSRDQAVPRLRQHLSEAIDRNDAEMAGPLTLILTEFVASEAVDEIRLAFEKGLVEENFANLDDLLNDIASGECCNEWRKPAEIDDAVEELRFWLERDPEPLEASDYPRRAYSGPPLPVYSKDDEEENAPFMDVNSTIRYDDAHVGRNDPCPCGSGRKFKKCCGSRAKAQIDL
jgi:hypothetical protein